MRVTQEFEHGPVQSFRFGYSPFGKPNLLVYTYFVDGLLIDTGQPKMAKEVLKTLKDLPVQQIYVTHFHEDHSGNAPALQKHFDCPVYCSALCAEIMRNPPAISIAQKIFWGDRPANNQLQRGLLRNS